MSYRKINYNIRPSKSTERKLLAHILRELCNAHSAEYTYLGLGSTYFADFKLFHKELHIPKMISFEKDKGIKPRVEFNKPFHCIEIVMEDSTTALLKIKDWSNKCIAWMDYDDPLENYMFRDIEILLKNLSVGSLYLMSCNLYLKNEKNDNYTVEEFQEKFETDAPIDLDIKDFATKNTHKTIRRLILSKIEDSIRIRNKTIPNSEQVEFVPLFFYKYADNAPMMTFGGYLKPLEDEFKFEDFNLQHFERFIKQNDEPYEIVAPNITYKEYELLNKKVPNAESKFLKDKESNIVPPTEKKQFLELYKYLPNYMNVIPS